jgi:ornithine lipid hydroxylase
MSENFESTTSGVVVLQASSRNHNWISRLASIGSAPFNWIERGVLVALTAPVKPIWRRLDAYSPKFQKTLACKIIAVSLFPVLLVASMMTGFAIVEHGLTGYSVALTLGSFIIPGLILAPLDRLMPWSRNWLDRDDSGTDVLMILSMAFWNPLVTAVSVFLTAWLVGWIHTQLPPDTIRSFWPTALHPILQVCLLLVVMDFFRYWYHRWMHENAFLWRWHAVHHSSLRLYWFNGVRFHFLEVLTTLVIWVVPFTLIQAPAGIVFVAGMVSDLIGKFQHTNVDVKLGPLEYVFSGPDNHRYHHSKNIAEGNKNYGGDIILWDHLFGTFHLPKGQRPSDDIGVGGIPDFPQSWLGLTLAPFNNALWRRVESKNK